MKISFRKARVYSWLRYSGIFLLGAAASLVFPPFNSVFFGYVAFMCWLWLLFKRAYGKKEIFALAYVFGFAFYSVGFSWVNNALLTGGDDFLVFVPLIFVAMGGFFGLFTALPAVGSVYGKTVCSRMLIFASLFVLFEWIRSFIFTGFPWNLLGTALSFNIYLIQGAAYIGTYGLSWLWLVFVCGIVLLLMGMMQKRLYRSGLAFILLPAIFFIFASRLYQNHEANGLIVRLVQPSIPQTLKWDESMAYPNFRTYIELSKKGKAEGYLPLDAVDLVVWGETASPYLLDRDMVRLEEIKEAVPEKGFLATGSLRAGMENGRWVPYNSLFVLNKDGIKDYYDKSHLVPFGEYLPFRQYLPDFMRPVAQVVAGDLGRGEKYKNISVKGLPLMGGAICYESIFPKESINPHKKPEVLLVVANDGWYGKSAGPYQHLVAAQMRAVEEGVTVIRSANTGISAVIDMYGNILDKIGLDEEGIKDVTLPLSLSRETLYGKYGNIIPLGLILVLLLMIVFIETKRSE